jgi:hypothetical protein
MPQSRLDQDRLNHETSLQVINDLEREGLIQRPVIGGVMMLLFHDEADGGTRSGQRLTMLAGKAAIDQARLSDILTRHHLDAAWKTLNPPA